MPGLSSNRSIEGGEPLPPPESGAAIPPLPPPVLLPRLGHYWPHGRRQLPGPRERAGIWGPSLARLSLLGLCLG